MSLRHVIDDEEEVCCLPEGLADVFVFKVFIFVDNKTSSSNKVSSGNREGSDFFFVILGFMSDNSKSMVILRLKK